MSRLDSSSNKFDNLTASEAPSTVEKLSLELSLLGLSAKDGFSKNLQVATDDKVTFGAKVAGVAAFGAAMTRSAHVVPLVGRVAVPAMATALAVDVISRAVQTGIAMKDTWSNPENFEKNKQELEPVIGGALFDYSVYGLAGGIGAKQMHNRFDDKSLAIRMNNLWKDIPDTSTPIFRNKFDIPAPTLIHSPHALEAKFYAQNRPSVTFITNGEKSGSGFFVDKDLVATNYHVVSGGRNISLKDHANNELRATLIGRDVAADLAVLRISKAPNDMTPKVVRIGNTDELIAGSKIFTIGHPHGTPRPPLSSGIFERPDPTTVGNQTISRIRTELPNRPGFSGGPIFDEAGSVVSVASQGTGSHAIGVHSSHLKALIAATKAHKNLPDGHWINARTYASGDMLNRQPTRVTTYFDVRNRYGIADSSFTPQLVHSGPKITR